VTRVPVGADSTWPNDEASGDKMDAAEGDGETPSHAGTGFLRMEWVDDFELVAVLDIDEWDWCPCFRARFSRPISSAGRTVEDARV
jgi:hypothetical protein